MHQKTDASPDVVQKKLAARLAGTALDREIVELWTAGFTGVAFCLPFPSVTCPDKIGRYIGEQPVRECEPQVTRAGPPLGAVTPVRA